MIRGDGFVYSLITKGVDGKTLSNRSPPKGNRRVMI
jgi:hypothetical protein